MRKIIFLFTVFSTLFFMACTEEPAAEDNSGKLGYECKETNVCDAGLACKDNKCISEADACKNVTCSNYGTCTITNSEAICDCNSGYVNDGNFKCVLGDICSGVLCSGHGVCEDINGEAKCDCDGGYLPNGLGNCLESLDPCAKINCSNHGTCETSSSGKLECICVGGYHPQGLSCISDTAPCEGVDCSDNGTCVVDGTSAVCYCNTGFIANGLECIDESNNPCKDQDCSGHGDCSIQDDEAICDCVAGYSPSSNLTCLENGASAVCDGVDCSDHGDCKEDIDGNAYCDCDPGYMKAGYMCIEDISSPCYEETCSDNGTCKVDIHTNEAYCECAGGFFPKDTLLCVSETVICTGVSCSGEGSCYSTGDGAPACDCNNTFVAVGTECVSNLCEPNPCETLANTDFSKTCFVHDATTYSCLCETTHYWNTATKTCDVNDTCDGGHMHPDGTDCVCDEGYEFDSTGMYCELISGDVCNPNPCASKANTKCVDNAGEAQCQCIEGYGLDGFNNCVVEVCASNPNPCFENGDENKNICSADGNTFKCDCDPGFVDNAGTCEADTNACASNPCDSVTNASGCESFTDGGYACICEDTYYWGYDASDGSSGSCPSCDTCNIANATGNCVLWFDMVTQECECDDGFAFNYAMDAEGNPISPACE